MRSFRFVSVLSPAGSAEVVFLYPISYIAPFSSLCICLLLLSSYLFAQEGPRGGCIQVVFLNPFDVSYSELAGRVCISVLLLWSCSFLIFSILSKFSLSFLGLFLYWRV